MMMPRIFGENLFDDFMNDFAFPDLRTMQILRKLCMVNMQKI